MAKHRRDGDDERPSNTTSGGERPTPAEGEASVAGGTPEGAAVYPPSPSDQAGERTSNVPPTKQLPPDPPPEEAGADETTRLRAERDALAAVCRNLGGNPDEVCRAATAGLAAEARKKAGPVRSVVVSYPGTAHAEPFEVEIPADTPEGGREAAVRAAVRERHGFEPGVAPVVGDAPAKKAGRGKGE